MPPLCVCEESKVKSKQGLYGDVIMEIDASVGRILRALAEHDIDDPIGGDQRQYSETADTIEQDIKARIREIEL